MVKEYLSECTGLGVSSPVADHVQGRQHHALVMVAVKLELCLCVVAVLHE